MRVQSWHFSNHFILSVTLVVGAFLLLATQALAQVVDTSPSAAKAANDTSTGTSGQPMTDLERFNGLEKRYFGHGYPNDTIEDRLFRMENLVFGGKTHAPMPERIYKLEATLGKAAPAAAANEALNPNESTQPTASATGAAGASGASGAAGASTASAPAKEAPKTFSSLFNQAQADIDATRFHAASEELEQAIQMNPNNAKAYSMLGDSLLKLQDREGAKEAFRACFQVDPFGADGRNAKAMLLKMVSDDTIRATAPQDTPQVVAHTIQTLNLEAADLANRYRRDGNRWANFRRYLGNIEAQKIEFETNGYRGGFSRRRSGIGFASAGYGGGWGRGEISDLGRLRSNYIRTDAQVQANYARSESARKSAFVQESTANLKDQMLKPGILKDDARLKALGTTLYCRYYGDETPSVDEPPVPEDPIQELKARAMGLTHR
jgi:tetratricopeptide (TPR) repeat protein